MAFDEYGLETTMFENTICIELNDIFEGFGQSLDDYKDCFDKCLWKEYC